MHDESYEAPAVEDRTSVTEPLNTIASSELGTIETPAWRKGADAKPEA